EIDEIERTALESHAQLVDVLGRDLLEELIKKAELAPHLCGRRTHRVPSEIAEKVAVIFHQEGLHTRACEQVAEHHPGRAAPNHQACGLPAIHRNSLSYSQAGHQGPLATP